MAIAFEAWELTGPGSFARTAYVFEQGPSGWVVRPQGRAPLELGPGYRPMRVLACGICATDLARPYLPFPLPQIVGHEAVVRDDGGSLFAVEINASHRARGLAADCPFCRGGLPTHCPERLVLGIHALPGGFGPWLLAPENALVPVPADLGLECAALVEPFAAALHGVEIAAPQPGEEVAVLGLGRLGLLTVAALAAQRRRAGADWRILAWGRREARRRLARRLGADAAAAPPAGPAADLVFETSGAPEGLRLALERARRAVHLKSTPGRAAPPLARATALVVDELAVLPAGEREEVVGGAYGPAVVELGREESPAEAARRYRREPAPSGLPHPDAVIARSWAEVDQAVRPLPAEERPLPRPRGAILHAGWQGPRITSSRCGDFRQAYALLAADAELRAALPALVTDRYPESSLPEAFGRAASGAALKVLVEQRSGGPR